MKKLRTGGNFGFKTINVPVRLLGSAEYLLNLKPWTKVQLTSSEIKANANQMESWLSSLIVVVPLSGILDSTQWFRFVGCERLRVHYESPHQSVSPAGVSRVETEYQPRGVEWRRALSVPSLNDTTHITFLKAAPHRTVCAMDTIKCDHI